MTKKTPSEVVILLDQIQQRFPTDAVEFDAINAQAAYGLLAQSLRHMDHNARIMVFLFLKNHQQHARTTDKKSLNHFCSYILLKLLDNTAFFLAVKDFEIVFPMLSKSFSA
jgi:hypothetical protein